MQKTIYIQKIFLLIVVTFSYSIAMAQQFKSPDVIPSSPQSQLIENFYEKEENLQTERKKKGGKPDGRQNG